MYINNSELTKIEIILAKYQDLIEEQNHHQNRSFPEGIFEAREFANECEKITEKIREREVKSRAKQIVRKRGFN